MQTILCVKCNSSFKIDETSLSQDIKSIRCPVCSEKITLRKDEQSHSLITCPECQKQIPETSDECPNCGFPIPQNAPYIRTNDTTAFDSYVACPECQQSIPAKSQNCPKCGYPLQEFRQSNLAQASELYKKAVKFFDAGEYEEAEEAISNAVLLAPQNVLYKELSEKIAAKSKGKKGSLDKYNKAVELYENEDFENALLQVQEAIKQFEDSDYHHLKKIIEEKIERIKIAAKNFTEASELLNKEEFAKGYDRISKATLICPNNKEYQELKSRLAKALAEKKYEIAQIYYHNKKLKESRTIITECVNILPNERRYKELQALVENSIRKRSAVKIGIIIVVIAAIVIPSAIYIVKSTNDKKEKGAWLTASNQNTISSYNTFLSQYPAGKFALVAKNKQDSLLTIEKNDWDKALEINSESGYNAFIQKHSRSNFVATAKEKIQEIHKSKAGKNKVKEIVKQYYTADSEKDFERIADFFEFNVIDYYSKANVSREELIQILSDYWNKGDLIQSKSNIDFESLKIEEKEDGTYKVSFKNDYEVLRSDKSKPNHFLTNTQITFNRNLKIVSINGNVISKWQGESTFSQTGNDHHSSGFNDINRLTQVIDEVNYKIFYPNNWTNYGSQRGAEFVLIPNDPINSDWQENIFLISENLSSTISLNSYVSNSLNLIRNAYTSFSLVNSSTKVGNSGTYQIIIYTYKYENQNLKAIQHLYVTFNKAYVLTFASKQKDFDSLYETASEIMTSFIIK